MDLHRFNSLPIERRAELVSQSGRLLTRGRQGCYSKTLYYMGSFFAEMWCSPANNHIVSVRGFTSNDCLEPYLDMIDLRDLKI
ncbi:hypothetical protein [Pontibacter diazotrophicus]|uniref:hypothetical protein n=1 Tax=Pontibacter diazotrophicus TaxID=1400979 RepID=UPI0011C04316|nr:hypothetical protein [Pontibacter diazotrophicus]